MKILFFTPYFYPYISGMTVYAQLVLQELAKKHNVEILTFKHDAQLNSHATIKELKISRMPFLAKLSKGFISPQSLSIFFKKIKNNDLLIINLPSVEGIFLVLLAKILGTRVLAIYLCQIDLGPGFINHSLSFLINLLVKFQLNLSNKIVTFSADYISSLNWSNKLTKKVIYIKPFIKNVKANLNTLKKLEERKAKQKWIGFVGRIAREKGLDYLIDAISLLPKSKKITLVFAGPKHKQVAGENKYYLHLMKKLKDSQINYLFLGLLSEDDLFAFYKSLDLIVLPSINSTEAYGLVQLEAMSVGTPVITSDLPGLREAIKETGMGLLVPARKVSALSKAIEKILSSNVFYQSVIGQNKLHKIYDKQLCIKEYEKIIKEISK